MGKRVGGKSGNEDGAGGGECTTGYPMFDIKEDSVLLGASYYHACINSTIIIGLYLDTQDCFFPITLCYLNRYFYVAIPTRIWRRVGPFAFSSLFLL